MGSGNPEIVWPFRDACDRLRMERLRWLWAGDGDSNMFPQRFPRRFATFLLRGFFSAAPI